MKILVTGGLGYIGSHISSILKDKAVIIDSGRNSSINFRKILPKAKVYKKKISKNNISQIFKENSISGVIHLASLKSVNDSVLNPLKYYENNLYSTIDLLYCMDKFNINNLIFSSSATVYGNLLNSPIKEQNVLNAINPYGRTKIMIENILDDYGRSNEKFNYINLRYFNPIGCNYKYGLIDQPKGKPQNLMPLIIKAAYTKKPLTIYGNDYNTPDGTCIRDYIHVSDLAEIHLLALKKIKKIREYKSLNVGLNKGISVLNLINLFEKTNRINVPFNYGSRRDGDSAICYADNTAIKKILNWRPKKDYKEMCRDAWLGFINNLGL